MKSSFKSKFEKNQMPDGSLQIKYYARRFSFGVTTLLAIIPILPVLVGVVALALGSASKPNSEHPLLALILFFGYIFFTFYWLPKSQHLIILTQDGIKFKKKQLAYKDIKSTGITTIYRQGGQCYTVDTNALGQTIALTNDIHDISLAESILEELRKFAKL